MNDSMSLLGWWCAGWNREGWKRGEWLSGPFAAIRSDVPIGLHIFWVPFSPPGLTVGAS